VILLLSSSSTCNVTVTLENHVMEDWFRDESFTYYVDCYFGSTSDDSHVCPSGYVLNVTCNGTFDGTLAVECPVHEASAMCESIGTDEVECEMI